MKKTGLLVDRPIAFYPALARELGGIEEAIFYQQIYYWSTRGKREDGFIYKTMQELEEETTLTRRQQDRVRVKLVEMGWLEVKLLRANKAPTLHYRPLVSMELTLGRFVRNVQNVDLYETAKSDLYETYKSLTETTPTESTHRLHTAPDGAVAITIGQETQKI